MSSHPSPDAKELALVGKVEMRIALADSDQKLEQLLKTYLAPLLLKLASESVAVRNKVISICQHINTRIKPQQIKLPVAALLKQFKDNADVALIRHFDILYIQQGISRLPVSERLELLPILIRGISVDYSKSALHASQLFHLLLRLLSHFKLPPRGSKEDEDLRSSLNLDKEDAEFLSHWFGKLMLLAIVRSAPEGAARCPGLSTEEYKFLTVHGKPDSWNPSADAGLNLAETKVLVVKFLTSGMFTDEEKFFPALFASADTNSRISDPGQDILKRVMLAKDLEDPKLVKQLLDIYFGSSTPDGPLPVKVALKIRILNVLSKSIAITTYSKSVSRIVEEGLLSNQQDQSKPSQTTAGREAAKFRSAIFSLINFVARHGASEHLAEVAEGLVGNLKLFIEDQGWPVPARDQDLELRGYGYETIGLLAKAAPQKVLFGQGSDSEEASIASFGQTSLELLEWLFRSLREDTSGKEVAVSIEEALSSVLNALTGVSDLSVLEKLRRILLKYSLSSPKDNSGPTQDGKLLRSTRYVATRFANRCLPFNDVVGRWIALVAASGGKNERHEVTEEGEKGLDPYWYAMLNTLPGHETDNERFAFPEFDDLVDFIFDHPDDEYEDVDMDRDSLSVVTRVRQFRQKYPDVFPTAISFCARIFTHWALAEKSIVIERSVDWERRLETLVSTDRRARQAVRAFASEPQNLRPLATTLRAAFVKLVEDDISEIGDLETVVIDLCSLSPEKVWEEANLTADFRLLEPSILSNNLNRRTTASHIYGLLATHPACETEQVNKSLSLLFDKAEAWKDAVGADINQASGALLALSYLASRVVWRASESGRGTDRVSHLPALLFDVLKTATDTTLRETVYLSIDQLSLFHVLSVGKVEEHLPFKTAVDKIYDSAKSGNARAILALGHFSMITEEPSEGTDEKPTDYQYIADKLYELHEVRQAEVQFSVGEALSCFVCGWDSKALAAALDIEQPKQSDALDNWDTPLKTPQGPPRQKSLARVLERTLAGCRNTKPALKKASVIWLLCLLQYCGHKPEIQDHLPQCQAAFKMCLSDRDEVVQEAASRGLGLVYSQGTRALKDELVRDLVSSFSDNRAKMSGTVTEDTQLFEPGALPTGDGSISTYKDILSLASEVGDSSLVYRFMSLAANNSIWSSRAAFGRFGLSSIFSDSSVDGYLAENPKLYPKLYRYRFDPNPNVQRSMNDIWNALVRDSSATIDKHFDAIMQDLLATILGREWRVRQAACAAIADLVQGRPLEKYEKYLTEIWNKCFKVLDDIKGSVAVAAAKLARVLTGILTRNLEAGEAGQRTAGAMLSQVLPFLFSTSGLESSAEDVRAFALDTLLQIIKKSNAKTLQPHIPELVERLLGLLSTLEPEVINYIHLNVKKYNLTEQKLDDMRLQSVRSSPLTESMERCLDLADNDTMAWLAPRIEVAMKTAVGLPSKVGCARILVTLSTRHSFQFKPHADGFLRLIEKYIHDRNETVASSYGAAAGYLARLASDKQILSTISFCRKQYFDIAEDKSRLAAGDIVLSISKHAPDRFTSLSADLLPFVFLAKQDDEPQVKKLFSETWNDNVAGGRAVLLYLKEIVSLADQYLESPKWGLKHASARTVADAILSIAPASSKDDISKANAEVVWPALDKAMGGKTWEGKEVVLEAFVRFVERGAQLWKEDTKVAKQIEKVAVREAKRVNKTYRPHALEALGKVLSARTDLELSETVEEIVEGVLEELGVGLEDGKEKEKDKDDDMDVDAGDGVKDSKLKESTLESLPTALLLSINPDLLPPKDLQPRLLSILTLTLSANSTHSKSVHLKTFENLALLFSRLSSPSSSSSSSSSTDAVINDPKIFSTLEALLLDKTFEGLPEAMRMKRAEALGKLSQIGGCAEWVRTMVRPELSDGEKRERSAAVRAVLGKIVE